jgi:excisionase family DNA binding protein
MEDSALGVDELEITRTTVYPEYMTLTELARYSSISKSTLRNWLKIDMPHYRVGRSIRVKRNDFDAWLDRKFRAVGTHKDRRRREALREAVKEVRK